MIEEMYDLAERGPIPEDEGDTAAAAPPPKQRVDPTKMVISRSRQMVTTSGAKTQQTRNKTPTRSKTPTRKK